MSPVPPPPPPPPPPSTSTPLHSTTSTSTSTSTLHLHLHRGCVPACLLGMLPHHDSPFDRCGCSRAADGLKIGSASDVLLSAQDLTPTFDSRGAGGDVEAFLLDDEPAGCVHVSELCVSHCHCDFVTVSLCARALVLLSRLACVSRCRCLLRSDGAAGAAATTPVAAVAVVAGEDDE